MTDTDRYVFVSQHFPPDKGGNASRVHDIATHLQAQSCEVTILCPPPCYPPGEFDRTWKRKETDVTNDIKLRRLWTWQPQVEDPGMIRRLAYYLVFAIHSMFWLLWNVRQYDAVITTTPPISTGAPGLLAKTLGKPWVVDVRDLWIEASISLGYLEAGSLLERISRQFQRLVLHSADRVTVTTEALGESLVSTYGGPLSEKTIHLPNGVDTERFHPEPDQRMRIGNATVGTTDAINTPTSNGSGETAEDRDICNGNAQTIIYTGNLGSAQDLECIIRAMTHLSHGNAVLRLVGGGDIEADLRRLTDNLGVQDRVEFVGVVPREEIPGLLEEATVGVAPLENKEELAYAMPTKVYEYMASGLPTVVTGRGEIERFVRKSGGGVCVANDPERVAERLDELLEDKQLRRRLADSGRDYVEGNYDREVIAQQLSTEMTRLVEDRPS